MIIEDQVSWLPMFFKLFRPTFYLCEENSLLMAKMKIKEKKQIKYNAILEVSEKLMQLNGLHALNLDDVAKEAKMAKGTLYLYFKSKEEILGALALKARKMLLAAFKENISSKTSAIDKLKGVIEANYLFYKSNRLYYDLVSFYEISERETETPQMQEVIRQITNLIVSIIEEGQENEEIRKSIDPNVLSISMWGMTVGVMQLLKVKAELISTHQALTEQKIIQNYTELFAIGIKK
ncbi:MAG: TetR/AcrR family transcriptional regulator [Thermonemataceae bacterium]